MVESPVTQYIWSLSWEKVPGSVSTPWLRLQRLQFRVPVYNPRMQASYITLWANWSSGFMLKLFVLLWKTWNVVKPCFGWPDTLQGLNNLKVPPPSYLRYCKACPHSRQSLTVIHRAVSRQVRSRVRGLLCFVSEAETRLFNFPNRGRGIFPTPALSSFPNSPKEREIRSYKRNICKDHRLTKRLKLDWKITECFSFSHLATTPMWL